MARICIDDDDLREQVAGLFNRINSLESRIMATLEQVVSALANLQVTAAEEKQEVVAALAEMGAQIDALKAQVAAGSGVTVTDLDSLVASLEAATNAIEGIYTPPPPLEPVV